MGSRENDMPYFTPPPDFNILGWGICFFTLGFSVAQAEIVMTSATQSVSVTLAAGENETVVASGIAAGSTLSNFTFSGDGTLTLRGASGRRLNLSTDNSGFTGTFVVDTGRVSASNANALVNATLVLTKGGGLMNADSVATWAQNVRLRGNGAIASGWSKNSTLSGIISNDGTTVGALTIQSDSGWVCFANGANTYSGGTTIAGKVRLDAGGTPLGTGRVTMSGTNSNLNLNGQTITTGGLSGTTGTISGTGAETWTWNVAAGETCTYSGSLPSISWSVQGAGTQEFTGTGTLNAKTVGVGSGQGGNLVLSGEKVLNLNDSWSFTVGSTATDSGTVLLKDDVQIVSSGTTANRAFWIGNSGTATLTLRDNASITLSNLEHFAVAKTAGNGTLNIHDQAKITVTGDWFVLADSGGNATMNMTGGEVDGNASFHMGSGTSVLNFSGGTIDISNEFLVKAGGTIHFNATTAGFGKITAQSMGRSERTDLLAGKIDFGVAAGVTVLSESGLATFENAFISGTRHSAANTFSVTSNVFEIQDSGTAWSLAFSEEKAKRSETLTIAAEGETTRMFSLTPLDGEGENWSEYGWVRLDLRQLAEGETYQVDLQLVGTGDSQELEDFMNEMMAFDTSGISAEVDSERSLLSIVGLTRNLGEDFAWFAYDLTGFNAQFDSHWGIVGLLGYQVPEPASGLLMLLGLMGILYLRKRTR
ncbi:MAG: PEP-CTERM sorting domain-containing protein [Planctomycetia bacterium]|nr:PEP-CTERM sorting domain-containing protein [Planctomycetia bacterium]